MSAPAPPPPKRLRADPDQGAEGGAGGRAATGSVFEWLQQRPAVARHVAAQPHAAAGVFRWLPPAAQSVVLCCLFRDPPGRLADSPLALRLATEHPEAMHAAARCGAAAAAPGCAPADMTVAAPFAAALRTAAHAPLPGARRGRVQSGPSVRGTADGAGALGLMLQELRPPDAPAAAPGDARRRAARQVLGAAGLCDESGCITARGFQFLLLPKPEQAWRLAEHYLAYRARTEKWGAPELEHRERTLAEAALAFPSHLEGCRYPVPPDPKGLAWFQDLASFGLIVADTAAREYEPTPLGRAAATPPEQRLGAGGADGAQEGDVMVASNSWVYLHSSDELRQRVLSVFADVKFTAPGLVGARITRKSSVRAFDHGIAAADILRYIEANAHPEMRKTGMPDNVVDQLLFWEDELCRAEFDDAVLFRGFPSPAAAAAARREAEAQCARMELPVSQGVLFASDTRLVLAAAVARAMDTGSRIRFD